MCRELDRLYVTSSSNAFNVFTAVATKDGKIYVSKNLSAKGYCGRKACIQKT